MWYNAGTVSVTAGSPIVDGAGGVDFVNNVFPGDAFVGPNGLSVEILRAETATRLILARPYAGQSGGGQAYSIQPTQDYLRSLTAEIVGFRQTYAAFRDTVLQGMFSDGTIAAPGIRYAADQDTGWARYGPNLMSAVTGGAERMRFGDTNSSIAPLYGNDGMVAQKGGVAGSTVVPLDIFGNLGGAATMRVRFGSAANVYASHSFIEAQTLTGAASDIRFGTSGVEQARIDNAGNLQVNTRGYNTHTIENSRAGNGTALINFNQAGGIAIAAFYAIDFNGVDAANGANAAFKVGRSSTGRSINATGTGNFTGSDYAEYMVKAAGCGIIARVRTH